MNHPDFRVRGRVFATLGYPDEDWAMVKLTQEEQQNFVRGEPTVFVAVTGAWGRQGCTSVRLRGAGPALIRKAMAVAWKNAAEKKPARGGKQTGAGQGSPGE